VESFNQNQKPEVSPLQRVSSFEGTHVDYKLLVDSIPDYAILMVDRNGIIQTWNLGAELTHGYKAEEIVGKHFSIFYTAEDREREHPQEELRLAIRNGRFEEEGWRIRKNGSHYWANVVITPLRDESENIIGFSKVTRDLSERRKADIALRESEERFRLMVASVKDYAIIMLDTRGCVVSWNAGAERIKGWSEKEILGQSFEKFYPPEDVAAGKTKYELEVAQREGRFEDYGWRVRKDGSKFWANVVITALRSESGELRGYSKVTRDITEKKISEEALKKAYDDLESFSYSVSHDLRAPLRSMDGFSEVLASTLGDKLDERSRNYLNRIRESSQKMAALIDGLLNLSRVSRTALNKQEINLSEIAQQIAADLNRLSPERRVEWKIPNHIKCWGDVSLLRVVLENLLSNAWKYTSKVHEAMIEFGAWTEAGVTTYFIKDNGAGFEMAFVEKLFGSFQRLHGANEFPGNGIGLATVKRIINRHGGEIWAEGEPEKGATFYFTLQPLATKGSIDG
jgi:PAS domain S-box-containing protein